MFILSMEFYVARLTLSEASIFPQPNMVELKLKEKKKEISDFGFLSYHYLMQLISSSVLCHAVQSCILHGVSEGVKDGAQKSRGI